MKIVYELLPKETDYLIINGKKCLNIIGNKNWEEILYNKYKSIKKIDFFTPIHGDPTFSNNIWRKDKSICFIDPRGYFNKTGIYGDPRYDIAKLYYSVCGGYDFFNRKL